MMTDFQDITLLTLKDIEEDGSEATVRTWIMIRYFLVKIVNINSVAYNTYLQYVLMVGTS